MDAFIALLAANAQASAQPKPWIQARSVLRRKNTPESILPALRALKHALSDEPNGKEKNKQHIDELRTAMAAIELLNKCKTVDELDSAFATFVDTAQHLNMDSRTTKAAVKKTYAVYGMHKATFLRQHKPQATVEPAAAAAASE
jgi:hypothetical protein